MPTETDPIYQETTAASVANVSQSLAEAIAVPEGAPEADEYHQESLEAKALHARAREEMARGELQQAIVHFLHAAKLAETGREWYLAAIALHELGNVFRTSGPTENLEQASRAYRRAIAAYEECGHYDDAGDLEYRLSCLRLWRAREFGLSWRARLESFLYWLVAGFGYRPFRVLITAVAIILTFALVYWLIGGVMTADEDPVADFGSAAYFSGATFLTIGYGDLVPAVHARWLTVAEGLIGVTTISFFVVVLASRLRH